MYLCAPVPPLNGLSLLCAAAHTLTCGVFYSFLCSLAFCFGVKSDAQFLIWLSGGGWEKNIGVGAAIEKSFCAPSTLCGSSSARASAFCVHLYDARQIVVLRIKRQLEIRC